jgi:hypothetical protein
MIGILLETLALILLVFAVYEAATSLAIWLCGKRTTGWVLSARWNDLVGASIGFGRHRWVPDRDCTPRVWTVAFRRSAADRVWWWPARGSALACGAPALKPCTSGVVYAAVGTSARRRARSNFEDSTTYFSEVRTMPARNSALVEPSVEVPVLYLDCGCCFRWNASQRDDAVAARLSSRDTGWFTAMKRLPHIWCVRAEMLPLQRCGGGFLALGWLLRFAAPLLLFGFALRLGDSLGLPSPLVVLFRCAVGERVWSDAPTSSLCAAATSTTYAMGVVWAAALLAPAAFVLATNAGSVRHRELLAHELRYLLRLREQRDGARPKARGTAASRPAPRAAARLASARAAEDGGSGDLWSDSGEA